MGTPPTVIEEEKSSVAPGQVALIVGLLILVLGAVWFFFLRGGDEEAAITPPPPAATEPAPEVDETEPGDRPVETFEVFAPRDPFEPLLVQASAGATGTAGTTPAGTPDPTPSPGPGPGPGDGDGGVDGDGDGDVDGDGDGSGTGDTGGSDVGGHRVRVADVFTAEGGGRRAQIQVDGTVYTVGEGDTFADNFEVISISGECVTMLFGDDQFTLCEGQEILK